MTVRDLQHPVPAGNKDPEYLGDGAYASHDGFQIWVSCDREHGLDAVALDARGIQDLVSYAKKIGMLA